jgi:hypothetical protein
MVELVVRVLVFPHLADQFPLGQRDGFPSPAAGGMNAGLRVGPVRSLATYPIGGIGTPCDRCCPDHGTARADVRPAVARARDLVKVGVRGSGDISSV